MSIITTDSQNYTNIANAIRTKVGTSDTFKPSEMASAILSIPSGSGTDVSDTTATASDVKSGKIFHTADGTKTTGILNFNWMGENPEFIKEVYSLSTTLDKTAYASWTPTTTATTLQAKQTLTTKETIDLEDYDYILYWISDTDVTYTSSWAPSKGSPLKCICVFVQNVFRRPSSPTQFASKSFAYNATQQEKSAIYYVEYYSSATAISGAYTYYSPWYISGINAPTFASTSATSTTLTINTPTISARCSTTYFTTANAAKVDQTTSTAKLKGYLYRVKAGTCGARSIWSIIADVYNQPL